MSFKDVSHDEDEDQDERSECIGNQHFRANCFRHVLKLASNQQSFLSDKFEEGGVYSYLLTRGLSPILWFHVGTDKRGSAVRSRQFIENVVGSLWEFRQPRAFFPLVSWTILLFDLSILNFTAKVICLSFNNSIPLFSSYKGSFGCPTIQNFFFHFCKYRMQ